MRVPLSWLADYVSGDLSVDRVAQGLTNAGLKVEAIHREGADFEGVVVGEVLSVEPHPKADRLVLVAVDAGGDEPLRIVCGARNFGKGDRVPVALVGATLPGGFTISERKVMGETSHGMLCAADELGLGDDHAGIMILPPDPPIGAPLAEVLGLGEVVLEIDVTPNRPDAMSLLGIAREVAAFNGGELRPPAPALTEGGQDVAALASIRIDDTEGCPRYLGMVLTNVDGAAQSPPLAQRRLTAAGVRPISAIVDATNYALLVTGHPMHAFDLDLLGEHAIVVRRAAPGEHLTAIDGTDRELDQGDLVIADAGRPVALAGIMGGKDSEVSATTTRVLLESAYFEPTSVLRTSKRHGLRSEASARFERGADPNGVADAARFASALMQEWAGGTVAPGSIDVYPSPVRPRPVTLRPDRARLVLGLPLDTSEMVEALNRFGLDAVEEGGLIRATVPTSRPDINAEEDLIEEIARYIGFERIPTRVPRGLPEGGSLTREQRLLREIRGLLTGAGLWEAYTSSLIGPGDIGRMAYPEGHQARSAIALTNPLVVDESLLRPSLLPGLVAAVARNAARRNLTVRLFEIGRCFARSDYLLPDESLRLATALHGPAGQAWHTGARDLDFYDLKGAVDALLTGLRIPDVAWEPVDDPVLHPTRAARVLSGERVLGNAGELSPEATERHDLPYRAYVAEFDLATLLELATPPSGVAEISRFPSVLLDLAVSVAEEVPSGAVLATAREAGGTLLEAVRLFDVYRGGQVGEGRKSLGLSLAFRRPDRTLKEDEAIAARDAIATALGRRHGASVRA
jgi:phenylalanyl-tRNA synthetase beta chain